YLHVRRDLWAKVTRALFYDLVELGEERDQDGARMFGVASAGVFFALAPAAGVDDLKGIGGGAARQRPRPPGRGRSSSPAPPRGSRSMCRRDSPIPTTCRAPAITSSIR